MSTPVPIVNNGTSGITEDTRIVLSIVTTSIIMIGIGCAIDIDKIKERFKQPTGLIVGIACQWVIMPLISFCITRLFSLSPSETLSVLVMGTCPGGSVSNIVTYFLRGDINLSIAMTGTSMILSIGLIPLLLFLYSKGLDNTALGIAIATLLIPLTVGVLIRWKYPKKSRIILRIGTILGAIAGIIGGIIAIVYFAGEWSLGKGQIIAAAIIPGFGMIVSYGVASLISLIKPIHLDHAQRRTISVEVGIQNVQVAIGVFQLSGFHPTVIAGMILLPMAYAASQMTWAVIYVFSVFVYDHMTSVDVYHVETEAAVAGEFPVAIVGGKINEEQSVLRSVYNNKQL